MPPQDGPQAARSDVERNRKVLLDAAIDALAQTPGASMADVARLANLTRATLYRHFGSRERLLAAMRAEALARAAEVIESCRLEEGGAVDALRRVVEALASLGVRFRPLLLEGADQDLSFLRQRERTFAPLHDLVRRGQEAGQFRTDLPPAWVVSVTMSLLTQAVRDAHSLPGSTAADLVLTTLLEGIAPRP